MGVVKAFLCFLVSVIAGTSIAVVLALGIASFGAAAYKSQKGMDVSVARDVIGLKTPIVVASGIGFVVGAGVIVWMFYGPRRQAQDPDEPVQTSRSEV